jgi:hypothetical protein
MFTIRTIGKFSLLLPSKKEDTAPPPYAVNL